MILDGRQMAEEIKEDVKKEIAEKGLKPGLATILIGNDPASELYVNLKLKACEKVGIKGSLHKFSADANEEEVLAKLKGLNNDQKVHGILIQLPLPKHLDTYKILNTVSLKKDVDGLHSMTIGDLIKGNETLAACTPKAVLHLLGKSKIDVARKEVAVIGASIEVGKPLAIMLLNRKATVSICHSETKSIQDYTKKADIVISCTGVPKLIKGGLIKQGAVVIDVGISKVDGKIQGDIDLESVKEKASHIAPVPGGVGPVTVAMLLRNTLNAYKLSASHLSASR